MKKESTLTIDKIKSMSYTDFVGLINQWNVLPGAHNTLSKWKIFSDLNESSKILEIACTTGFSSRELALLSKCKGKAFDLSSKSVQSAIENKNLYAPNIDIDYFVKDGYKYETSEKFSHIVLGASLKFFPDSQKMLNKCIYLLKDGGYILASPFYIKYPLPKNLIKNFKKVFGIEPTIESYKDIINMYKGLEIIYQEKIDDIDKETEEEIEHYCHSTIKRACKLRNIKNKMMYEALYNRLYEVKKMSNELRPYQGYTVLVLRYRSFIYPGRFVELF